MSVQLELSNFARMTSIGVRSSAPYRLAAMLSFKS